LRNVWLAAALLLAACNPQPEHMAAATASPSPSAMPALEITGHGTAQKPVIINEQSGNRKLYRLVARSYVSRSAQSIAQAAFQQTTVTFYDKDGTKMTAQAPTASLEGGKQVILSGGVHAKTSTGLNLTCDRLAYDKATGLLHGSGNVRITGIQGGEQQVLTGNTFTSDVKLTQMVMR
jgi:LPS export ABC transporter protein LptC